MPGPGATRVMQPLASDVRIRSYTSMVMQIGQRDGEREQSRKHHHLTIFAPHSNLRAGPSPCDAVQNSV